MKNHKRIISIEFRLPRTIRGVSLCFRDIIRESIWVIDIREVFSEYINMTPLSHTETARFLSNQCVDDLSSLPRKPIRSTYALE